MDTEKENRILFALRTQRPATRQARANHVSTGAASNPFLIGLSLALTAAGFATLAPASSSTPAVVGDLDAAPFEPVQTRDKESPNVTRGEAQKISEAHRVPREIQDLTRKVAELVPEPGMSASLLTAIIKNESRFQMKARAFEKNAYPSIQRRSPKASDARALSTSYGLTQVLGETARGWGISVRELQSDPELQVHLGGLELGRCLRREHGSQFWALACYNAGARSHRRDYPESSKRYAKRVFTDAKILAGSSGLGVG